MSTVTIWQETITLPTYGTGKPDKNPMFFEKRIYQGSSGVVYPHAVVEKIEDVKHDHSYLAVFLENDYLKIMILPELGGRVQMAYDKLKQRHFIYYNQVIKPALVGLTGPWISGGIEFNWPQHHRPSTFDPIDYTLEEHADGSKTVWVNEVERMFRTKALTGFTLHPGKAYLEIGTRLFNRTPLPQTFLWWANPAVKVNDHYQSVFPPDVNAVFDHGKRDVSTFPIATGTYYKVDYSPGTDISKYKNIPVPTSYMAIQSDYDFVGGYEHDTRAGVLHVANHHVSPGKKQWTWGHGDFGRAWDRNLTDEDGPYIELMTGAFTDNQPDFSWMMPYEEKTFTQYFLPYRELGVVKNATKDVLLNLQQEGNTVTVQVFVTATLGACKITLAANEKTFFEETAELAPEEVFIREVIVPANLQENSFTLKVATLAGKQLICYEPAKNKRNAIPEPAKIAQHPAEIANNEQLFLTGQHLEQYRHATFNPVPYYQEALRRDAGDIRCNNALGLWYLRRGQFEKAVPYFKAAIATAFARNPNPYDGEPLYNLGLALEFLGDTSGAYNAFYKASWSNAWQDSALFSIARIDLLNEEPLQALEHSRSSLDRNAGNSKAYVLKAIALRKLGRLSEAIIICGAALDRDPFNIGALFEKRISQQASGQEAEAEKTLSMLLTLSRQTENNLSEYALDHAAAGCYADASRLLACTAATQRSPMFYYYLGWFAAQAGDKTTAAAQLQIAAKASSYLCFPNRLEDIMILKFAMEHNPADAKAPYYLGNLWYDKRQYTEAIACWEMGVQRDDSFPTVYRNLGIAYYNKLKDAVRAMALFRKAFALDPSDARVLMELDQLSKRMNRPAKERLAFLESHLPVLITRDDLYLERIALLNFTGNFGLAAELLMQRQFHPWEGGEGKVSGQYIQSLVELAKQDINRGETSKAIERLQMAQSYPHNLGEGKLYGAQENDVLYWLGCAYEAAQEPAAAREFFEKAAMGSSEPGEPVFYNDQQPDKIFYQALAKKKLGDDTGADQLFGNLVTYATRHENDVVTIDYFAVSLPNLLVFDDDLDLRNTVHCRYLKGLGLAGLNRFEEAKNELLTVLELDAMHFGAKTHLDRILKGKIG